MGGIVCQIIHNAVMTDASSDAQWRAFYANPEVAQSVVNETDDYETLCDILAKTSFSNSDKLKMAAIAKSLWPSS